MEDHKMVELIGLNIKRLRLERGWSQQKLADELDITPRQVAKYEQGLNVLSVVAMHRLCKVFKVERAEFDKK